MAWCPSPARHEGGTPNLLGAVALAAACETLASTGFDRIAEHDAVLTHTLRDGLAGVEGLEIVRVWSDGDDGVGIVTFRVAGVDPFALATALADDFGIGVRAGKFCAHPLLDRVRHGDGAVRASIGIATTVEDVHRLVRAVGVCCVSLRDRESAVSLA